MFVKITTWLFFCSWYFLLKMQQKQCRLWVLFFKEFLLKIWFFRELSSHGLDEYFSSLCVIGSSLAFHILYHYLSLKLLDQFEILEWCLWVSLQKIPHWSGILFLIGWNIKYMYLLLTVRNFSATQYMKFLPFTIF